MKKIPYGKQSITETDIEEVIKVLKSDFLTQGPKIKEFEEAVAQYHQAKYAVAFSNGTAALHGAYSVIGIGEGDEIITSPISFVATSNGAIYCGATPKFADISLETNCIDINQVEKLVTKKTKVISPVSLAGYPVDLKKISKIAKEHNCYVLHDAAHAIGSRRDGTFGLEFADMAMLSFHPVKHIATGEGGMILTNNEELYKKLLLFRSHGITKENITESHGPWYYEMVDLGYNYRITDIQCALGASQFKRIDSNLRSRNIIAKKYDEAFKNDDRYIIPPNVREEENDFEVEGTKNLHSYHLYTLRIKDKEKRLDLYKWLHKNGILAQIHYIPIHMQPYYMERYNYKKGMFPNAETYYESEISLPMFHSMSEEEQDYVIEKVLSFEVKI